LWLFSNYGSSNAGTVVYDNLRVVNLSDENVNNAPVAEAGDAITVYSDYNGFATVMLDGSGSTDLDNDSLFYSWRSDYGIVDASGPTPTVSLYGPGFYTITLEVSDGELTDIDTVEVDVFPYINTPPIANAGDDITVIDTDGSGSEAVLLDGSGSFDPDGSILSYEWRLNGLVLATSQTTSIELGIGIHFVILEVTDEYGDRDIDILNVEVIDNPSSINLSDTTFSARGEEQEGVTISNMLINHDAANVENRTAFKMSTYPNPSSDVVDITFNQSIQVLEFEFFDMQGRMVQSVRNGASMPKTEYRLDVDKLSVGTYFLKVFDTLGRVHQKQLLIRR